MQEQRKIIITTALPYANGDIHLGHMVEHFLTDFWARFQTMRGHKCIAICADDTHGTPIMIAARKRSITPEALIAESMEQHLADFRDFEIHYDNYSSTNTPRNQKFCDLIYSKMAENGHISKKTQSQAYCDHDQMFLPDRFVKGICPKCGVVDQYGDQCESCMSTHNPLDMKDAHCVVCGNKPVAKESEHLYFQLEHFRTFLQEWVPNHSDQEVSNKLKEWLSQELQDWCISRDKPYFGFKIPGTADKYYYVWVDAPVGYLSSTEEWCERNNLTLKDLWNDPKVEIYHNIGKDIIYFHTLFWPAMLKNAGFNTPTQVFVHGMLTVNGEKMSKSRGTFVNARTYLKHLDPTYFRYYMACKLNHGIGDLDLNFGDFVSRVNSDLIGKITNIASRGAQMLQKKLNGKLGKLDREGVALLESARGRADSIAKHFENRDFAKALLEIRLIADDANKYFDGYEPWKLIDADPEKVREILTTILNLFRILAIYLKPILPSYVARVETLFGGTAFTWSSLQDTIEGLELAPFQHLIQRIDPKKIDAIIDDSKQVPEESAVVIAPMAEKSKIDPIAPEISADEFFKVDLRVARIEKAEHVEGADKLLRLTLDIGDGKRNVFAGIKSAYKPEDLQGRLVMMVANLAPRKMKFGMSEGMVAAAGPGGKEIFLLSPDSGAKPGMRIS
jgi:methionyl-tRNA synthetase